MGYSGRRLERRIASFRKVPRAQAPEAARLIFPDTEYFAAIGLEPMQP
jgi:hypothetical protein